jgi:hypothetical protein
LIRYNRKNKPTADEQSIKEFHKTKPKRSGKCWSLGNSVMLHHRPRGVSGPHPATQYAKRVAPSSPSVRLAASPQLREREGSLIPRILPNEAKQRREMLTFLKTG